MNIIRLAAVIAACLAATVSIAQTISPIRLDGQVSRVPIDVPAVEVAAFTPIRLQVRINNNFEPPELLGVRIQGAEIRATFFSKAPLFSFPPYYGPTPLTIPGLPPGTYKLLLGNSLAFDLPTASYAETSTLNIVVSGLAASMAVSPMAFMQNSVPLPPPPLSVSDLENWYRTKHYLALGASESQALLSLNPTVVNGNLLPPWTLTEPPFRAWPNVADAPSITVPVCRFFNPVAVTHFYSAKASDCALLAASSDWTNEGVAFRTLLPVNGVCSLATQPVYRLFSQTLSNHRYTQSAETYNALQLRGYAGEGVAFCSPSA